MKLQIDVTKTHQWEWKYVESIHKGQITEIK